MPNLSDLGVKPQIAVTRNDLARLEANPLDFNFLYDPFYYAPAPVAKSRTTNAINPDFSKTTRTFPSMRRLLTVIVSDPSYEVPVDEALIFHETAPFEGTDEDVMHQIGISTILDEYNDERTKMKNPEGGYLKPLKMSQLKKQIIVVANL